MSCCRYFEKSSVAALKLDFGDLAVGDTVHIKGPNTDITQKVEFILSPNHILILARATAGAKQAIDAILANGESEGAVSYMHGLAKQVSTVAGGEPVDVVLCRKTLDDPYYTVVWKP